MRRRWARVVGGAAAVAAVGVVGGLWPAPVDAGGPITVVDRFEDPVAGEDLEITFTILLHGQTPVDVSDVAIVVVEPDGDQDRFVAESAARWAGTGRRSSYPKPAAPRGASSPGWFGPQDLGELDVASPPATAWWVTAIVALVGALVIMVASAAVVTVLRRRRQPEVRPKPQVSWM